ncbi:Yop proteins translocation protein L [Caloramator mitchellensis]|uniref:Yop proteins translocation protein L n=1 Tax=Caloramator mitchellensis TaxID=908809 RepID=A0A0R3K2C4_CALMK|nr:FliH/SctL family protein [Caloramator mitchellensis]KRQ87058.1 Yop proteins translocation protein L [Caloramator mitchellensis]
MQSYSKVIKYTNINGDAIITPPQIEINNKSIPGIMANETNEEEMNTSIINEAIERADFIIEEARTKAEKMLKDAEIKLQEVYKNSTEKGYNDGFMQGYQEGYKKGMEEVTIQTEEMKKNAENYIKMAKDEVANYIAEKKKEIIAISVDIAKQIIKSELSINADAIFNIAREVISKSMDKSQILVKVNPKDYSLLKRRKEELEIFVENPNDLILLADSSIEEGNIYAETPSGFVDGRIDTQLDMILQNLLRNDYDARN